MTRRAGHHCTAPTRACARAFRNRDWKAEAAKAAADKAAADKAAADKAVWQAAYDNNEPELKLLFDLVWIVHWHNPEVRRRMRLAWAPASFCLYMLEGADTTPFFATPQRAAG